MLKNTISKLTLLITLVAVLCAPLACASSGRLDRSSAAAMIRRSPQFTHVYVMLIRHGSDRRYLDPVSPNETRQQGEARAVENWRTSYPYRAVLMELGLVDVRAKYVSTRFYGKTEDRSTYDLDIRLTPQGEALWRQFGLPVDADAVPLARRQFIDVTGITGANGTHATAEFSWRWEPTVAGAAMTRGTAEFNRLPDGIKQMFEPADFFPTFKSKTPLDLTGTRQGVASFQRYDDGWRVIDIHPVDTTPLNPLD